MTTSLDLESLESLDIVLDAFELTRTGDPSEISAGTLNRNFRVPTAAGIVFARSYRPELTIDEIQHEHAVTRWVADRNIPAIAPRVTLDGDTLVEVEGQIWALFPWIEGRTPARGTLTPDEAEAIGEVQGQIQRSLSEHPESEGATLASLNERPAWDTATSLEALDLIERRASEMADPTSILEALSFQRHLLETTIVTPFSDFHSLPSQLLHGDFHDQQILFGSGNTVVGVVDWELTRVAARVWELIRSLNFSRALEPERLTPYLRGFRRHVTLTEDECRAGIELWWQNRLHGTWVYQAYFLEGNDRVGAFLTDTDQDLRRFADPLWRTQLADRLVAAAT